MYSWYAKFHSQFLFLVLLCFKNPMKAPIWLDSIIVLSSGVGHLARNGARLPGDGAALSSNGPLLHRDGAPLVSEGVPWLTYVGAPLANVSTP